MSLHVNMTAHFSTSLYTGMTVLSFIVHKKCLADDDKCFSIHRLIFSGVALSTVKTSTD